MKSAIRRIRWIWAAILGLVLIGISVVAANTNALKDKKEKIGMSIILTSPAFMHGRVIPVQHTCDSINVSPRLSWTDIPVGTKSLALIVDDPDAPDPAAPKMTWVHWLLYNIPHDAKGLIEGLAVDDLADGTLQGVNDWHRTDYRGPCPPVGKHRYFFKLYALDTVLPDMQHPTKAALEKAMHGHVLAQAELIGLYQRQ
jgi:Raf kinase inhibitor-like YbhB/YbcL family protein